MSEHEHPPTKVLVVIGIIVAFWLLVSLIILSVLGVKEGWPAFLALPLFFLAGGTDPKKLIDIFAGGITGLILAAAIVPIVTFLVKGAGVPQELAILLIVGILVFIIIAMGGLAPLLFSNYTFVYFTVALAFPAQNTLPWLGTLVLGGAFFIGACLLSIGFVTSRLAKE